MTNRGTSLTALGWTLAIGLFYTVALTAATSPEASSSPLKLVSSRVSLAGTSNIHAYTASSTVARIVRLQVANGVLGPTIWEQILKPGALEVFEIAIPVAALSSPKDGIDKNMYKALKLTEHPEITFRLSRIEAADPADPSGAYRGIGMLQIAGVEREVTLALKTQRTGATFTVTGEARLLMTDFGIAPPKAMMGMLKTDPKVRVTFETVFEVPLT